MEIPIETYMFKYNLVRKTYVVPVHLTAVHNDILYGMYSIYLSCIWQLSTMISCTECTPCNCRASDSCPRWYHIRNVLHVPVVHLTAVHNDILYGMYSMYLSCILQLSTMISCTECTPCTCRASDSCPRWYPVRNVLHVPVVHLTAVHDDILWVADLLPPPVYRHLVLPVDGDSSHAADKPGSTVNTSTYRVGSYYLDHTNKII